MMSVEQGVGGVRRVEHASRAAIGFEFAPHRARRRVGGDRRMRRWALMALATALAVTLLGAARPADAGAERAATISPYQFAHVPGATLGYREAGSGRPLLLLAGFGLTAAEWDPALIELLAVGRRVIVFDNRGVGTSTGSLRGLTIRRMAKDASNLIAELGLRRTDVLGWSMGGYIAQELALRHPRSVRRLVLAGTDPGGAHTKQPTQRVLGLLSDPNTSAEGLLSILFPEDRLAAGYAWFARVGSQPGLLPNAFTVTPEATRAQVQACGPRWSASGKGSWSRLPRLDLPVLVAGGGADVVVPPINSRRLARRIPGARLRIYPRAGHAFPVQEQASFAPLVDRFLSAKRR